VRLLLYLPIIALKFLKMNAAISQNGCAVIAFIEDGIHQGKRAELVGGGLRRSHKLSGSEEHEAYDERVLGCGDFVERLHQVTQSSDAATGTLSVDEIIRHISPLFSIEPMALRHGGKRKEYCDARGAICYIAVIKCGHTGAAVARALNISSSGVTLAARRGEEICKSTEVLQEAMSSLPT
jgi:hypothetical protein